MIPWVMLSPTQTTTGPGPPGGPSGTNRRGLTRLRQSVDHALAARSNPHDQGGRRRIFLKFRRRCRFVTEAFLRLPFMALTTPRDRSERNRPGGSPRRSPPGRCSSSPTPARIQALIGDEVVIDSERALLGAPTRPVPRLRLSSRGRRVAAVEARGTRRPGTSGCAGTPWTPGIEEGRRLRNYPPNPYHRVDCHPTQRRLRVEVDGTRWSTPTTP